jgi:hypothetical protein
LRYSQGIQHFAQSSNVSLDAIVPSGRLVGASGPKGIPNRNSITCLDQLRFDKLPSDTGIAQSVQENNVRADPSLPDKEVVTANCEKPPS